MSIGNAINGKIFTYVSPVINFKSTGVTTLFTTLDAGSFFVPITYTYYCDSVTTPGNDSQLSIGWTAAGYTDFDSSLSFAFNTLGANKWANQTTTINAGIGYAAFPANTAIRVNITIADSGTALTGRIIFNGYYI